MNRLISIATVMFLASQSAHASTDHLELAKHSEKADRRQYLNPKLPCAVTPTLDFMEPSNNEPTQEELLSAAWFARAVQLPTEHRTAHWKQLKTQPLSIQDIYAGSFGLHATLLEFENRALVLYRGTQDPLDYILNATFFASPGFVHGLPGWVHKGFLINFGLSWRNLRGKLKKLAAQGKSVSFAAHSLGGVLSQYAAWRAEKEGIVVDRIFAFQSPNPGDEKFKLEFDKRFAGRASNLIYSDDITPHMPPARIAVREFSDASMRILSGALSAIVRQAKYTPLTERYRLAADGTVAHLHNLEWAEDERNFWRLYREKARGQAFPKGLGPDSTFVADHNIEKVVCTLARGL
ncbi:MAG: hypothetical protein FJY29_13120 [Betaproteobacteria bacterium]|nr:hypothetical protein [Betaproteobacteria bacterium]